MHSQARGIAALATLATALTAAVVTTTRELDVSDNGLSGGPGPELRLALAERDRGRLARAALMLAEVAERHPVIGDHADLLRMRILLSRGRFEEAVELGEAWRHLDSPLRTKVYTELGNAHARLENQEAARRAWEIAREGTTSGSRLASLHFSIARSYERSEMVEQAARSYLTVWSSHPTRADARPADERLDELEEELGVVLRTPHQWRLRADRYFRRYRNESALAAYEKVLAAEELAASDRRRAMRMRAETLFRLRRYTEATEAFTELDPDDETDVYRERARARAGHALEAAEELEKIGRRSRSQGPRALLVAALLIEGERRTERARKLYDELVRRSPGSSQAGAALWRLGWAAYREGRYEDALVYMERLRARAKDPLGELRSRYWHARTLERSGQPGAEEAFARIALEFPFSYYGWRAALRANGAEGTPAPAPRFDPGVSALSPSEMARPRILLEAGLRSEALDELNRLYDDVGGLSDRLELAQLYNEAGEYRRPQSLMLGAYEESLARGPSADRLEMWWYAWPTPFAEDVRRGTGYGPVDAPLVYAIMREESGYRPWIVSPVGARGLLQIMPETGARLARDVALSPYDANDLFRPEVNIRLGSFYLDELLERFSGKTSAAIGSYNAGPGAVDRWLQRDVLDDDEWVEAIPYDETRKYVKRVLRSLHVYRVIH